MGTEIAVRTKTESTRGIENGNRDNTVDKTRTVGNIAAHMMSVTLCLGAVRVSLPCGSAAGISTSSAGVVMMTSLSFGTNCGQLSSPGNAFTI